MPISVSAPGKIFLLGEHSVVYGKPALLSSINRRLKVTIKPGKTLEFVSSASTEYPRYILRLFERNYQKKIDNVKISISSDIPLGKHIGSSAAVSVALIAALMRTFLKIWDPVKINELAFKAEKTKHANPSGADNTVSTFGGLVWYRKETEFLKTVWNLPIVSYKIPQFVLIDTGSPRETTGDMVKKVAAFYKKHPKYMENLLSDQEKETKRLLLALREGNAKQLLKAIVAGESNLEKMGVVSRSSMRIIRQIETLGGAAKICGGGGQKGPTGFLLALHDKPEKLISLAQKLNLPAFLTKLGEEGVRVEKN